MKTRAQLIDDLKTALITAMLDIAEDLAADHVDEIMSEEDQDLEFAREVQASALAQEIMEEAVRASIELTDEGEPAVDFMLLRAQNPRHHFYF